MKKPLFLLLLAPFAHAAVISEPFDTYNTSSADYGWTGGWQNSSVSTSVSSTTPVAGGGSYLVVATGNSVNVGNRAIKRTLDSSVIDTTQSYTVTWDFRLDTLTNADWDSFNDRINFLANNDTATGTSNSSSWIIGVVGQTTPTTFAGRNWYFFDNNTTSVGSFSNGNMHNTEVALVEGDTYRFSVTTDPSNRSYSASVTNLTNITMLPKTTDSATDLGFRNYSTAASQNLVFGTVTDGDETRAFSLDSITITGVPEPSTALLGALGALALLRRRR